ncbi:MAG: Alpha-L-Rha alpha,3-L-rhamnosyltransferase [Actinobacteria bacterium]|nr:Alpha-L-Rha alpha,3-L-rhamnosyltransferase [Actinomycetota bacterium]
MSISVALCTYNGSAFLDAQLESIARQRLAPDELVVCDDGSTDATLAILEGFSEVAPFAVRIHTNERRLGYVKNFEKAISLCTAEIVALADQDDVWDPDKLRASARVLEDHPDVGLVCTDAEIVDRDLNPLGVRMAGSLGFGSADQALVAGGKALHVLVRTNFVTGATMAFRASFVADIVPIPESWVHDGWIALVIALRSQVAFIDRPLVQYRQHDANLVGAPKRYGLGDLLAGAMPAPSSALRQEAEKWHVARERAASIDQAAAGDLQRLLAKEQHMLARARLPDPRLARVPRVVREFVVGNYHRYSAGSGSAVKDLLRN